MTEAKKFSLADLSYEHQQAVEAMKSQLLIVLINRLGGEIEIPVAEIDATGRFVMAMEVNQETRTFTFAVREK